MQEFKDYEIIVSDAQSTDKTRAIAKSFGCKIVEGGLPSVGRNNGAKVANAPLILFLDADVVLPPLFLQENLAYMKKYKIDCATAEYEPITSKPMDKTLFALYNFWMKNLQYIYPQSGGFCIFCKKKFWKKTHGFPEKQLICEDFAFVSSVKKAGGIFRVIPRIPVLVDVRRLDKEGRFNLVKKYVKEGALRMIHGDSEVPRIEYVLHGQKKDVRKIYEEMQKKRS